MRLSRSLSVFGAVLGGLGSIVMAQDSGDDSPAPAVSSPAGTLSTGVPLVLDVARQRLKNFLSDETALAPFTNPDGSIRDLESTFTIGTPSGRFAVFWDAESCRLLGALDLKAPPQSVSTTASDEGEDAPPAQSPYTLLAEGTHPFANSTGVYGEPAFFGFRVLQGAPVFLYTSGNLVIEERLWLENEGNTLKQTISIRDPQNAVSFSIPAEWKSRVQASVGEWKDNVLTVPKEDASEISVTYQLPESNPETAESN